MGVAYIKTAFACFLSSFQEKSRAPARRRALSYIGRFANYQELPMTSLNINGTATDFDVPDDMPLLWVLRDVAGLTGTKFGCGVSLCGACTIHLDGAVVRSCVTPVSAAVGKKIVTIEAIGNDPVGARVQSAWRQIDVVQCGYCQSGQVMAATALLTATPKPTDADIDNAMSGNICRCGTYGRIRAAIKIAAAAPPASAAPAASAAGTAPAARGAAS
jgi:isoquinoline 1-oxidoreductase alpha subunit